MSLPTEAIPRCSHCFCITQPLSAHGHSDSKPFIMFFTPSKMQRSFPASPQRCRSTLSSSVLPTPPHPGYTRQLASQEKPRSPLAGTTAGGSQVSAVSSPRGIGQAAERAGVGAHRGCRGGHPLPNRPVGGSCVGTFAARGHGNVLQVGCVVWDLWWWGSCYVKGEY